MNLRIFIIDSLTFVSNFPAIWRGEYENLKLVFDYLVEDISIQPIRRPIFRSAAIRRQTPESEDQVWRRIRAPGRLLRAPRRVR